MIKDGAYKFQGIVTLFMNMGEKILAGVIEKKIGAATHFSKKIVNNINCVRRRNALLIRI